MRGKKGFLLGEYTLKIILAVLGIVLLLYVLFSLYTTFSGKRDLEKARASLDYMADFEMNLAKESGKTEFPIQIPRGWIILTYYDTEKGGLQCRGVYCLCICPEKGWFSEQEEQCVSKGVCESFDYPVTGAEKGINIGEGVNLVLEYNKEKNSFVIKEK